MSESRKAGKVAGVLGSRHHATSRPGYMSLGEVPADRTQATLRTCSATQAPRHPGRDVLERGPQASTVREAGYIHPLPS